MEKEAPVLEGLKVASPCTVPWESMRGDDRVRHCGQCRLNVFNLSAMSRREAEALVRGAEGRLCVRFYRRADGTVLTRDCPVGLRAVRRRLALLGSALAAMLLGMFTAGCTRRPEGGGGDPRPTTGIMAPPETVGRMASPEPIQGDVVGPPVLQGEVHVPEKPK
jgi:hypothetical protein